MNGKRTQLKNKRYFAHTGNKPFWEEFEDFFMEHYEYEPTIYKLVTNDDGANWITSCSEYLFDSSTTM